MKTLSRECFTKVWIDAQSRKMRTGNTFLEKCLHAFELLGRLQQEGLDFVFKGGTSLLLRLPNPKRLSIDIDIVSQERADRLERILQKCVVTPFSVCEEDMRRHNRPPRRRHLRQTLLDRNTAKRIRKKLQSICLILAKSLTTRQACMPSGIYTGE